MLSNEPVTKIDPRFSDPDAVATGWDETLPSARNGRIVLDLNGPGRRSPPRHSAGCRVARWGHLLLHRPH